MKITAKGEMDMWLFAKDGEVAAPYIIRDIIRELFIKLGLLIMNDELLDVEQSSHRETYQIEFSITGHIYSEKQFAEIQQAIQNLLIHTEGTEIFKLVNILSETLIN